MRRVSYYVGASAAAEVEAAVNKVVAALGDDTPKHVALSALLSAGAAAAEQVIDQLAADQAAGLTARLDQLRHRAT